LPVEAVLAAFDLGGGKREEVAEVPAVCREAFAQLHRLA
jgi:hypothetical protein